MFIFSECLFLIEYNCFFYFYDNKATDLACCWNLTQRDKYCLMNGAVCIEKMLEDRRAASEWGLSFNRPPLMLEWLSER